ncbi:MAG: NADH:ubiquinone oxidoreductase subunit NDUFA12 [Pseudomonadota bacterium]
MDFLKRIFIWWHNSTFGVRWTMTKSKAQKVGEDAQGNEYFEEGGKPTQPDGGDRPRRWVVYHGVAEASRVPPEWHGWLHHTIVEPPTDSPLPQKKFEKPYLPNMTGTPLAYRPKGSLARASDEGKVDDTYEAWSPENA